MPPELQAIIQDYGIWIVMGWAFLEGEMGMVLAGSLAHQGYFDYREVAVAACVGAVLGDQLYFWVGRRYGNWILARFPIIGTHAGRARDLLQRYNTPFILANRFMYGVRIVGPIVVGMTDIPAVRFTALNIFSGAVWALTVTGLGYLFAEAVQLVIHDLHLGEMILMGAIIGMGVGVWLFHQWRERRRARP
jgi:membrane protein DedA with SNARE-associated domain